VMQCSSVRCFSDRGLFGCAVTIPHTSSMTALQPAYQPFEKESLLERGLIDAADVFEDDRLDVAFDPPSRLDWFARDYTMFFQGTVDGMRPFRILALKQLAGWHHRPASCHDCTPANNVFVSTTNVAGVERKGKMPDCPREQKKLRVQRVVQRVEMGKFEGCRAPSDQKKRHPLYAEASFMHRLANSKVNLCFRGTDVTSSRNVDGFWTGTLNVLITEVEDMYKYAIAFQCEIPWRNFTYAIEGSAFKEDPRRALRPVLDELFLHPASIREKLRLMEYYSRKVLWNAPNSTAARSTLRAMTRQCLTDEMKMEWLQRTHIEDGEWSDLIHGMRCVCVGWMDAGGDRYGDHPLFSRCAFPDTSATREEQREPCVSCWVGYKTPTKKPPSTADEHHTTSAQLEVQM